MKSLIAALLIVCAASSYAMELSRVYVARTGSQDLETSASGYAYHSASGQPSSYAYFSTDPGQLQPVRYVQSGGYLLPQFTPLQNQQQQYAVIPKVPVVPIIDEGAAPTKYTQVLLGDAGAYEKGNGENYHAAKESSHGEKGEKGYSNKHGYEKGRKGQHENEGETAYYAQNGGKKQGHQEAAGGHASQHQEAKGSKGGNFEQSGYHKKGQKTSGFHKVYHKDEYKKDHSFYDESGNSGHYDKYGNEHAAHKSEKGAYKKGGNSEAGYDNKQYGKKGFHDKGRYNDEAEGYKGEQGQEGYHSAHSDYAKEAGKSGNAEHGYSEGTAEKY